MRRALVLTAVLAVTAVGPAAADGVRIGIDIGVPLPPPVVVAPPPVVVAPPPVVVAAPPQLVIVPGSPVLYAPAVSINLFSYRGRYYSFHEGAWFVATRHGGPWAVIAPARVPQPVLAVPVRYYKVPPGHAKKMGGHGAPRHGCPPGLAKQGRC